MGTCYKAAGWDEVGLTLGFTRKRSGYTYNGQPKKVLIRPLCRDAAKLFPPHHITVEKGHGRIETREIWTSTELNGYLKFPYVAQVFQVRRTVVRLSDAKSTVYTAYCVTSLSHKTTSPAELLNFRNRKHWTIENRVHYVRDVTYDEDRSRVRKSSGPRIMASLRNAAISLLRLAGAVNIADAIRHCRMNQLRPLRLVGINIAQ